MQTAAIEHKIMRLLTSSEEVEEEIAREHKK